MFQSVVTLRLEGRGIWVMPNWSWCGQVSSGSEGMGMVGLHWSVLG